MRERNTGMEGMAPTANIAFLENLIQSILNSFWKSNTDASCSKMMTEKLEHAWTAPAAASFGFDKPSSEKIFLQHSSEAVLWEADKVSSIKKWPFLPFFFVFFLLDKKEMMGMFGNCFQKWCSIFKNKKIGKHVWQLKNKKQFSVIKNLKGVFL